MTTWTIKTALPTAGTSTDGFADFTDSGLRLDDSVTGSGATASILDGYQGADTEKKLAKLLAHLQRTDKNGRAYLAYEAGGPTTVKAGS